MVGSVSIDFMKYSDADLETSLSYIDRDIYPLIHEACLHELERRISVGDWSAHSVPVHPEATDHWRRLARAFPILCGCGGVGAAAIYGAPFINAFLNTFSQWEEAITESLAALFPMVH